MDRWNWLSGRTGSLSGLGKLVLTDYKPYVPIVAEAYAARPTLERAAIPAWEALARHTDRMYKQLLSQVEVIPTADDPYPDYESMMKDIRENRRMKIYSGASDHPLWDVDQNIRFRAVHDYVVHRAGEHPFTLRGELGAYNRHVKIAPPIAHGAIFTEIVGQTCSFFYNGEQFNFPQKCAFLYGFDYDKVGVWYPERYAQNFTKSE